MNDKEYEVYIKRIEKLEKRVEALLIIEKQNTTMRAALEFIRDLARNPNHRTMRTQTQMCSFFDDIVLPTIYKAIAKAGE